jgi:hypothetical protein
MPFQDRTHKTLDVFGYVAIVKASRDSITTGTDIDVAVAVNAKIEELPLTIGAALYTVTRQR